MEEKSLMVLGSTKLPLQLGTSVFSREIVIADGLTTEGTPGVDIIESHHCVIDMSHRVFQCGDTNLTVSLCRSMTPISAQCAGILCLRVCEFLPPAS